VDGVAPGAVPLAVPAWPVPDWLTAGAPGAAAGVLAAQPAASMATDIMATAGSVAHIRRYDMASASISRCAAYRCK
jgi:hypothetical protein